MIPLNIAIPDGFLREEIRNGYTISQKMKEVWAVELDLYTEFDRVCKKYGIQYCVEGGTMLGAVRHRGFIPWDDDFDIAMLRSEYKKLCEIAPEEFRHPYFFQTEDTDPGSARGHAQLRNSLTTGMLLYEKGGLKGVHINQGIFIDIFPFDTVPESRTELESFYGTICEKHKKYQSVLRNYRYFNPQADRKPDGTIAWGKTLRRYARYLQYKISGADYKVYYQEFENACQTYNQDEHTKMVADFCIPVGIDRIQRYREDFYDLEYVPFEFLQVPVFRQYDRNLKRLYGADYMTPCGAPSEHGGVLFDTDRPYTCYLEK